MTNPDFPPGFGQVDALFAHDPPLVRVRRAGFFFVPPAAPIDRHVGAQIFDEPLPEHGRRADFGRLFVRKKVLNPDASPARADLRNIRFEVTRVEDGAVVGTLVTDSAGHALSEDLPRDTDLLLREVFAPPTFQPPEPLQFRLEHRREVRTVTNFLRQPGPYGQG